MKEINNQELSVLPFDFCVKEYRELNYDLHP